MNVTTTSVPDNIETFIFESAAIAAGVVTAAIIVALIGYVLHLKQRRRNESREANIGQITGDLAANDYSSLRRIMEQQTVPVSVEDNSTRIQSEEVYHEINELQVLDAESLEKVKNPKAIYDKNGYLDFSQSRELKMSSEDGGYRSRDEPSSIDGYLTVAYVKSRAQPTKHHIEGYSA